MRPRPSRSCSRRSFLAATAATLAGSRPLSARTLEPCPLTRADLERMDGCQLDALFAEGQLTGLPVGAGRGHILWLTGERHPKLKAAMQESVWRGKVFGPDGHFVNQWRGFQAIASTVAVGESWFDGKPCVVLEYPPGTRVFGNARDELREVGPGLLLGRFYDRCPCPKLRGYFVLELGCRG